MSELRVDKITNEAGDGAPEIPGLAAGIDAENWDIEQSGTDLIFKFNGTAVLKVSSNGAITSTDDITAFGSI